MDSIDGIPLCDDTGEPVDECWCPTYDEDDYADERLDREREEER